MSEQENENKKSDDTNAEEDAELSALLDSAAKDFDAPNREVEETDKELEDGSVPKPKPPSKLFPDDFLEQASEHFSSFFSPGPDGQFNMEQLGQEINRLAEASTQAAGFDASTPDNEFASIFAQTLKDLAEGADSLPSEENLMNMLGNMDGGHGDPGELLPFMQTMMQNLLSKEILYPSLSSFVEKYPVWLEENKATLTEEKLRNYEKQYSKMKLVCAELDGESTDDTEDIKKARFDKILALMQEISSCGQPPADLVGEDMGGEGLPQIPPGINPDQCSLQ